MKRPLAGPFLAKQAGSEYNAETELHEIRAGGISGVDVIARQGLVEGGFHVEPHSRVVTEGVADADGAPQTGLASRVVREIGGIVALAGAELLEIGGKPRQEVEAP